MNNLHKESGDKMIENILSFFARSMNGVLRVYENKLKSLFVKFKNIGRAISKQIRTTIQGFFGYVFGKPTSLKDYVKSGDVYVSKRFVLRCSLSVVVFFVIVFYFALPFFDGKLWTAQMVVNSEKYHDFSGKARVLAKEKGDTVYLGEMQNGSASGIGEVFEKGKLVYKGEFKDNLYNGEGTLYQNGVALYEGQFVNNSFSGEGQLFYDNGKVKFAGIFADNIFLSGSEYYSNGFLKYKGGYSEGNFHGEGKLFSYQRENACIYDGNFVKGLYSGEGILYSQKTGKKIYEGSFDSNKYSGIGREFDEITEKLVYDGSFLEGIYNGTGKLYNGKNNRLLYEGDFVNGGYDGEGKLYAISGILVYQGRFMEGEIKYSDFFDSDLDAVRTAFGKEDDLYMLENSFVLFYDKLNVAFTFSFAQGEEKPSSKSIKFFGEQKMNGVTVKMPIQNTKKILGKNAFTEYNFEATEEDAFFFGIAGTQCAVSDDCYSIKYLSEDSYIRLFSTSNNGVINIVEIGGI